MYSLIHSISNRPYPASESDPTQHWNQTLPSFGIRPYLWTVPPGNSNNNRMVCKLMHIRSRVRSRPIGMYSTYKTSNTVEELEKLQAISEKPQYEHTMSL